MTTIISAIIAAAIAILLAAVVSASIKFEGGSNPKDPAKRRIVFWIFAVINPVVAYALMAFAFMPSKNADIVKYDEYNDSIMIAIGAGFVAYILIGFILSKLFKHGKLGHWF
tara:strand:+ start:111 stop:446 length:336 start_codon:yes stop_codon:yes gene_type:complete